MSQLGKRSRSYRIWWEEAWDADKHPTVLSPPLPDKDHPLELRMPLERGRETLFGSGEMSCDLSRRKNVAQLLMAALKKG